MGTMPSEQEDYFGVPIGSGVVHCSALQLAARLEENAAPDSTALLLLSIVQPAPHIRINRRTAGKQPFYILQVPARRSQA